MASEASWQTSSAGGASDALPADEPMDQRTVETLLRRLVERVEDSERRYGEALDELHARLDQLSQTTEAARETSALEDDDTFDRLHSQVSNLARRFETESAAPLDDFERLGKALSERLDQEPENGDQSPENAEEEPEPSPFAQAAMAARTSRLAPASAYPDFDYAQPEPSHAGPSREAEAFGADLANLDQRLVDMADRLERSIGEAMPTSAIEALNTRLDEIGNQLSQSFDKAPNREALEHVERQISDMGQQLSRAEEQLGKVGGVEEHLLKLIERLDQKDAETPTQVDPAQLQEIAAKAATEAARIVADDSKKTTERLDAMHRDLAAMSDKSRESGDKLVSTLEAVHESLKQLVQQVERGGSVLGARPRAPFTERARQAEARPAAPFAPSPATQAPAPQPQASRPQAPQGQGSAPAPRMPEMRPGTSAKPADTADVAVKDQKLRDRLGAAIPDFKETETAPPFGRATNPSPEENAVDLDASAPQRGRPTSRESLAPKAGSSDDLVAAARRAAQAAATRAEERDGRRSKVHLPGSAPSAEPGRRRRSLLIISAAILLALSAILLYGRLSSKPETEATPAATEESAPAPADTGADAAAPETGQSAPASEPAATPDQSGSWAPLPNTDIAPMDNAVGQAAPGFTDIAKSSGQAPAMPSSELSPEPQLASLKPVGQAALPPGVFFSVEEPDAQQGTQVKAPMPPAALGPKPLRKAAADGDPAAQYAIAIRYAEGKGTKRDLKAAATWLERAGRGGLALAQYRLAAMYERGHGVDKDLDKARTWYAAAAERGNVKAMHNLAVSVSGRDGSAPDYPLAAKWYGQAASHGLPDSQFNLGILAEHGLGMTKDLSEAYKWFSLAAAQGDAEAAKRREVIGVQLAPEARAKAEAAVEAWKAKPAPPKANTMTENPAWAAKAPASEAASMVSRAQTLLNKLGYDVGPPDGLVGSRTRSAIKQFQQRNGLQETGEVSGPLVTKLEHLTS